jgi:glucose-6-phosphate isomerase
VSTLIQQDVGNCLAEAIGGSGVRRAALDRLIAETEPALATLRRWRDDEARPFLTLPARRDDLAELKTYGETWRAKFDRLVVLGTGGASLGAQTLAAVGDMPERLVFLDNGDGDRLDRLLSAADVGRTGFLVVSKSGGTAETLAQAMLVLDAVEPNHVTVVTQPGESAARRLAAHYDLLVLDHDPDLGGRFSALSLVGLLPAYFGGVDGEAARAGAQDVLEATLGATEPGDAAPAVGAALTVAAMRGSASAATVLMPYGPNLGALGLWYRQLWAESLGKDGKGSTPVLALGPVDQHSQLQLFLGGPADKLFTILEAPDPTRRRVPSALAATIGVDYLAGQTIGALVSAEARATAETLAGAGRPVRRLTVPASDAQAIGALMMHFMLETVIAAHLLGVDPFDQPAVEQGKVLARRYLEEAR